MNADDLTVKTVRDGAVCTLILGGSLDLLAADEFLQQAARVSNVTAFMYLGELIEIGQTEQMFTAPRNRRTDDYVTGRFG